MNRLGGLPNELKMKLLVNLDRLDIMAYCEADTDAKELCMSEYLWERKAMNNFPGLAVKFFDYDRQNMTPMERYLELDNLYEKEMGEKRIYNILNNATKYIQRHYGINIWELKVDHIFLFSAIMNYYKDSLGKYFTSNDLFIIAVQCYGKYSRMMNNK